MITNLSPKGNDISLDSKSRRPIIIQPSNPSVNLEGGYVKQPPLQRIVNGLPESLFAHSSSTILRKPRFIFLLELVLSGLICNTILNLGYGEQVIKTKIFSPCFLLFLLLLTLDSLARVLMKGIVYRMELIPISGIVSLGCN